ncbi:hypothetical protein Trydic_g1550 [Trypoxylus dichotomus]
MKALDIYGQGIIARSETEVFVSVQKRELDGDLGPSRNKRRVWFNISPLVFVNDRNKGEVLRVSRIALEPKCQMTLPTKKQMFRNVNPT